MKVELELELLSYHHALDLFPIYEINLILV